MPSDADHAAGSSARRPAFTPAIDALIREIDALGAHQRLWRYLYRNRRDTPLEKIEADLSQLRDQLRSGLLPT